MIRKFALVLSAVSLAAMSAASFAQKDPDEDEQVASTAAVPARLSEEYLLLGDVTRGAGEPMIAVDPTNPRNIIAVAMGNIQQVNGQPATANSTELYHSLPRSTITWLAVTHDGGSTWKVGEFPILSGKLTRCPDAFADVTKDGTFIAGCEPRQTIDPDDLGMSAFRISKDKGDSWGPVVQLVSDFQLNRFAPGLKPISGAWPKGGKSASNSPWDRPFTYIDDSTGVIYAQAGGGWTEVGAEAGKRRPQAYITASTDGGRTFGPITSWDSPEWQQQSRGLSMSAGHGVVAVTYIASRAPASANARCPCAVLGLSRDRGRTFSYRVLPNISIPSGLTDPRDPRANGGLNRISIDPTKAGRIALLKSDGPNLSVAVSEEWGETWGSFVPAGRAPGSLATSKQAFEYSRDGVLGLMWRAIYKDQSYDIWASISRDGGKSFSNPVRVSHARSPGSDPYRSAGRFGDDIQDFSMDRANMHMVWGDSRAGFQGVFYGRLPLSAFTR
jgi:hypothetical protein